MTIQEIVYVFRMKTKQELVWHERYHSHEPDEYELHYFLEGRGTFLNNNTRTRIRAGQLFISPPGIYHSINHDDLNYPITYYAALLKVDRNNEELMQLFRNVRLKQETAIQIGTRHRFFFEELKEKSLSKNRNRNRSAEHKLISFLYDLAENSTSYSSSDTSSRHIEKALEIMQKSIFNHFQLSDLCRELQLSEEYFIRLFKKHLNTTPMKYFTRLKIEAASALLCSSNKTVKEVSWQMGFANQFHFTKTFKKYTGETPVNYRNNFKNSPELLPQIRNENKEV